MPVQGEGQGGDAGHTSLPPRGELLAPSFLEGPPAAQICSRLRPGLCIRLSCASSALKLVACPRLPLLLMWGWGEAPLWTAPLSRLRSLRTT